VRLAAPTGSERCQASVPRSTRATWVLAPPESAKVAETGVLAGKSRRALDSTVLEDAVIRQDAIMQLVAQIRRVRRCVPAAKALTLEAHDYDSDAGKPPCAWDDRAAIDALRDGYRVVDPAGWAPDWDPE